jgi:hypothetical protein
MKHSTVLLLLALLPWLGLAQKITVSEPITLRSDIAYELIGDLGGRILLFRDKTTTFEVMAFDKTMREAWSKELEVYARQARVLGLATGKADFTLLYQGKEKGQTVLWANKYGPGATLIDSICIVNLGSLPFSPGFMLVHSDDRSKVLIYYVEKQDLIKAMVFDIEQMKLLWKTSLMLDDFNYYQHFQQVVLDNHGNMTLIIEKDNFRSKRNSHHFELFTYFADRHLLERFDLPIPEKLTYDVYFTYDHVNNRLVGGGLYSERNLGRPDGYFFLTVAPHDPSEVLYSHAEFTEDFILNVMGKEADRSKGIPEAEVKDIVLRRDGGILLICERNRTYERRAANMGRTVYDVTGRFAVDHYYDELFVLSIHPTGETHWKAVLHKKQYSQDDNGIYSSFFLFRTPSNLRFLFNDEIKYENTVSEYILSGSGETERKSLLSTANLKLRLRFRDAVQLNSREIIIPSERRNRLRLVRLEY